MYRTCLTAVLLVLCFSEVKGQLIKCRSCVGATDLSDCESMVVCDSRVEECYMDKKVTNRLTVEYTGGCRHKLICEQLRMSKRSDITTCAKCCNTTDCNSKLCGIDPGDGLQCFNCDSSSSTLQGHVRNPDDCVTLTTCAPNEVCYSMTDEVGHENFHYTCKAATICKLLMRQVFNDLDHCYANRTIESSGQWTNECGDSPNTGLIGKRATSVCHACCGDTTCNHGTCRDIQLNLYRMYKAGIFDPDSLMIIGK
ncbi:hypothetical protein ACF0H5_022221 [Mactra antiquata]